jgi:hypothetical protein
LIEKCVLINRGEIILKGKSIIITVLLIAAAMFIYIGISSTVINENYYRRLAYRVVNNDKTINNWETADVDLLNIKENPARTAPILSAKVNKFLLFLNGGHYVRVVFDTTQDSLIGPIVLYFNPFTKQCFGGALRM